MSEPQPLIVLDASLTLAWALLDEASVYSDAVLAPVAESCAVVPRTWLREVSNGLLMAERRGRYTAAQRAVFVDELRKSPIEIESASPQTVLESQAAVATEHGLTAYDVAYLDLALRRGLAIATQGKAIRRAARAFGVVAV